MRPIAAFLFALACAASVEAAPARTPLGEAEAQAARSAASACTGDVYSSEKGLRSAPDYLAALPEAGDAATGWNERRADEVYALATSLLKPAIPAPERALDAGATFKCPAAPAVGVRLLHFLAGPSPSTLIGPTNTTYWLGMAYRRGVGAAADPTKARQFFLQTRMLGHAQLTGADWGASPTDDLIGLLRRPQNRALLEDAGRAKWKGEAQYLLAELHLPSDPMRARALFEEAVAARHRKSALRLATLEADGTFGEARLIRAVELLAPFARSGNAEYAALLATARRHNRLPELPVSPRQVTMAQLGGKSLLARAKKAELDSLRGRVPARGLLAPDGRILLVELSDPQLGAYSIGSATLAVFKPDHLPRLQPETIEGRPLFAWINLPAIVWR